MNKADRRFLKKDFLVLLVFAIGITLQGCGSVQLSAKEVQIELGSEASEEIGDYVSVEDKYRDEFEQNAVLDRAELDISEVNIMHVGEYNAKVKYEGNEIIIKVSVVDTTPPTILQKKLNLGMGIEWLQMTWLK